jgi:ribose-phosphate pyrophosphokinase
VTAVDVHNPDATLGVIKNFNNIAVDEIHKSLINNQRPDLVVFPDAGARTRYRYAACVPHIVFEKARNQQTGEILGHVLTSDGNPELLKDNKHVLIVDDICDGGATFLSIAKAVNAKYKSVKIDLFVTHGIFSKGRKVLEDVGIQLFTTNSLPRNPEGILV